MLTLTFRSRRADHKTCLRAFCNAVWRGKINRLGVGWFLEYQDRGVEHYHLLMDDEALRVACWPYTPDWRTLRRRGQGVHVLSGEAEERIASLWQDSIPDWSDEASSFNRGGILEVLANPDRAHDYLANYCRKLSQKTLPVGLEPPGRWWWLSDRARPAERYVATVTAYPHERPMRMIRDEAKLGLRIPPGTEVAGENYAGLRNLTSCESGGVQP